MSPQGSKLQQGVCAAVNVPKGKYPERCAVGNLFVMATGGSGTVYVGIVDDDESHCRFLARILRAAGMQPISYSPAEAFRADARKPQYDCLVLDVQLPGIFGRELRNQLVAEGIATPVHFLTAYDDLCIRAPATADGCAGVFLRTDAGTQLLDANSGIARGRATG